MTPFGQLLRRERQDRKLLLGDLAKQLNISAPYLSQLETGQRAVPDGFVDKLAKALSLSPSEVNELDRAAAISRSEFILNVRDDADAEERALAHDLARSFARLTPERIAKIRDILGGGDAK